MGQPPQVDAVLLVAGQGGVLGVALGRTSRLREGGMMLIAYDADELWVVHEHVRQTRSAPDYGCEHDLDFVQRLWECILEPKPVELSRGELLQITRQVSAQLMQGQRPIGREVLAKAFAALLQGEEPDVEPIPLAFERAEYADTDPDDGAGSGADAAVEPGRNVPEPA